MLSAVAKGLEAQELIAAVALALLVPTGAMAQATPVQATATDPALRRQADALIPVLAGKPGYATLFSPAFQAAVAAPRFAALAAQLRETLGDPRTVERIEPAGAAVAIVTIGYDRGSATMQLAIDPAPPHVVTGLRITATALRGDTLASVQADVAALPGIAQIGVYALDAATPTPLAEVKGDTPAPLGSAFKLWVLAEAARQVAAGERRWDEVVPVGTPSLPSGVMQGWPAGAPVTVQTLATLMISISDNTATDTLLTLLGRDRVDATATRYGGQVPVLTTREAFVLKSDPALAAAWAKADTAQRRALLAAQRQRIATATLDPLMFSAGPVANDSIEWFASPRAMARVLAALRDGGPVVRAILSINPGVDPGTARRFAYVGYKGGSEPGVLALDTLVQAKDGRWYVVAASWHRPDAAVDEAKLMPLVTRALGLIGG